MSRCLPYTPPVIARTAVEREALLEPIKLQRELEKKAKKLRKKEKREKKREKKEKSSKVKHLDEGKSLHFDETSTFARITEDETNQLEKSDIITENEANQLEKSDITTENELPTFSENICYLSDGTQNGTKRKRTIIRIKSLSKRNDPAAASDAACLDPNSGKVDFPPQDQAMTEIEQASTSDPTSSTVEKGYDFIDGPIQTEEDLLRKTLIEKWVQPMLQSVLNDFGDEEWLFESKQHNGRGSKRFKANDEVVPCPKSQTMWPQAHWLPEAGSWALPFVVPF